MKLRGGRVALAGAAALMMMSVAGCSDRSSSTGPTTAVPVSSVAAAAVSRTAAAMPAAVHLFMNSTVARLGVDTIEVWVCQIPQGTSDPTFNRSTLRLDLDPATLADLLNRYVQAYFTTLSHGMYRPVFVAGKTHPMSQAETPQQCLDAALDKSSATSNSVLAVATAEDGATVEGGFASPGTICPATTFSQCSARSTRRGAYVGASDFHPDWGPEPAVDLEEHEIGHTLGWTHSGEAADGHVSGIDVMSNSASPRDFDPARRDGPDTLGVNRLAARWIPLSDVVLGSDRSLGQTTAALMPSTAPGGTRLMVLPVDGQRFLTVEYLPKSGLDDFLPHGGVTITLIDQSAAVCGHPGGAACVGFLREQLTEVGTAPFYDLLTTASPAWNGFGWTVQVKSLGDEATVVATVNR